MASYAFGNRVAELSVAKGLFRLTVCAAMCSVAFPGNPKGLL